MSKLTPKQMATVFDSFNDAPTSKGGSVSLNDFYAYMPEHNYIFVPSRQIWPGSSVNARIPPIEIGTDENGKAVTVKAAAWLDQNRPVEQLSWAPGAPSLVQDKLIADGGWFERPGCRVFNLYRPPVIKPIAGNADRWLHHVEHLYGENAAHIISWLAHRVQKPNEKINHALVLGGKQGIGKDTLLEPVKQAVGPWNFCEVSPQQVLGRFNGFLKSVILRVSEARDLGEFDRFAFYDHSKALIAAPPDVLRIDEQNRQEYAIPNLTGVIITTNHKADGIYLPADDRRHFVAWSDLDKTAFTPAYWNDFWRWYESGGSAVVAHYLAARDLASFDSKAPPPQTEAFFDIVNASRAPEDGELADALDLLGWPEAITLTDVINTTSSADFQSYLKDRRNSRRIPHRLESVGYVPVRNPDADDGLWRINSRRQVIYGRSNLSYHGRLAAARKL
jgi:hypothetical protein